LAEEEALELSKVSSLLCLSPEIGDDSRPDVALHRDT
jgi:hypothetical protein